MKKVIKKIESTKDEDSTNALPCVQAPVSRSVFDNELDSPIVGKFYNVRCAKLTKHDSTVVFVPIIGELHSDAQFNVKHPHYHIDGRFVKEFQSKVVYVDELGKTNQVLCEHYGFIGKTYFAKLEIVIKKKKCRRRTTGINPVSPQGSISQMYNDWYKTYLGKSCKGKKCPHLGTTMLEVDGRLVCPLHKLNGCKTSEKIVDYVD
jgi:hypothetical protein